MTRIVSNKKLFGWMFALWVIAVLPALVVRYVQWKNVKMALLEGLLILAAVLIYLGIRSMRTFVRQLSSAWLIFLAIFFTASIFSQLAEINEVVFPFTSWHMYAVTSKTQTVNFQEYQGLTTSGERVNLNPSRYFPLLQRGMLTFEMIYLGKAFAQKEEVPVPPKEPASSLKKRLAQRIRIFLADHPPVEREERKRRLKMFFEVLLRRHNQVHTSDPLRAVEIIQGTVDLDSMPHPFVTRRMVVRYEVNSEGGLA